MMDIIHMVDAERMEGEDKVVNVLRVRLSVYCLWFMNCFIGDFPSDCE
jgi:hypothetical protein